MVSALKPAFYSIVHQWRIIISRCIKIIALYKNHCKIHKCLKIKLFLKENTANAIKKMAGLFHRWYQDAELPAWNIINKPCCLWC